MVKLNIIVQTLNPIKFVGDLQCDISHPISLNSENSNSNVIMWVRDANLQDVQGLQCGTLICSEKMEFKLSENVNIIFVKNPRESFRVLLDTYFTTSTKYGIASTAIISPDVKLSNTVYIGENVVIEDGCLIGNKVMIGHNTVISQGTIIGSDVRIGANCTIGGTGFGYEKDSEGKYILIPHIGNVVIDDQVHNGNNTCIDRAVMGSTLLQANVKVDNLVHIAHGVNIGENSLIIANSMIAGSTIIGRNVWVAPSVSVLNNIKIGDNALLGMGAIVLKKVNESEIVIGNPGKVLQQRH